MSAKRTRKAYWRRERRLAKASGFTRGIKRNPKKHGHGAN